MIKEAFIVPHSPILIPTIGKNNTQLLAKTTAAYKKLAAKLIASEVDTIIIISPHGERVQNKFSLNIAPEFTLGLKKFGDFATAKKIAGDTALAQEIKETLKHNIPLQLVSQPELDYGSVIPLLLLTSELKNIKIISLFDADLEFSNHYAFGQLLSPILAAKAQKIAIIASADLSHRLKRKSPAGYSPKGAKFDNKVIEFLNQPQTAAANLLKMDTNLINEAHACGLKAIILLLGLVDSLPLSSKTLAYQTELGIGYLSMDLGL